MQEGGCHGAHTLQGEEKEGVALSSSQGGRRQASHAPCWAAIAAHQSSAPHRALPGTPVFLHPHTARHRPGDMHTAFSIREAVGQAAHTQMGLAGRGTDRSACRVTAGRALHLALTVLALCREG